MVSSAYLRLAAAILFAVASAPAFAQETQSEIADRIVKEQIDLRASQVERVMSAPARAFDHADNDPYTSIRLDEVPADKPSAIKPAAPWRPPQPGGGFPWVLLACLLPVIPLALLAFAYFRKWRFDGR